MDICVTEVFAGNFWVVGWHYCVERATRSPLRWTLIYLHVTAINGYRNSNWLLTLGAITFWARHRNDKTSKRENREKGSEWEKPGLPAFRYSHQGLTHKEYPAPWTSFYVPMASNSVLNSVLVRHQVVTESCHCPEQQEMGWLNFFFFQRHVTGLYLKTGEKH